MSFYATQTVSTSVCNSALLATDGATLCTNLSVAVATTNSTFTGTGQKNLHLGSDTPCNTGTAAFGLIAGSVNGRIRYYSGGGAAPEFDSVIASKNSYFPGGNPCYSSVFASIDSTTEYNHNHIFATSACVGGGANRSSFNIIDKSAGSFVIDHPNPQMSCTHRLIHYFVEAPTNGDTLYRYEVSVVNGTGQVLLPDYFKHLNRNVSLLVTGKDVMGTSKAVVDAALERITVQADVDGKYNVLVFATRKDAGSLRNWQGNEVLKDQE